MKLIIKRSYDASDKKILQREIREKIGRYEKIKKILKIKKCTEPEIGESYLILEAIRNDEEIEEETIIEDRKVFNILTSKRFEIIEILNREGPLSIKEMKNITGRDYKNVYDDISAMSDYLLVNLVKYRKERVMIGKVKEMKISI